MNYTNDPYRQQVLTQALAARTPEQLATATCELNAWVAEHPDDLGIQWAYEQMALVKAAFLETSSLTPSDSGAQEQALAALALAARTPFEIEHAKQALDDWLRKASEEDAKDLRSTSVPLQSVAA